MYERSCLHEAFWKAHTWSVKLLITHFSGSSTNSTLRAVFSVDSMKCGLKGSVAWFSNSVCIVFGNIISAQGSGEEKVILFHFLSAWDMWTLETDQNLDAIFDIPKSEKLKYCLVTERMRPRCFLAPLPQPIG